MLTLNIFRFALVHLLSIRKFCDKGGKVRASVSYGLISSFFTKENSVTLA